MKPTITKVRDNDNIQSLMLLKNIDVENIIVILTIILGIGMQRFLSPVNNDGDPLQFLKAQELRDKHNKKFVRL